MPVEVPSLDEMPEDVLVHVLSFLETPKDVVQFEATCRRFLRLGRQPEVWEWRLVRDYDLKVQATVRGQSLDLQQLYQQVWAEPERLLRFKGVFTDGGCDSNKAAYWVDNLFMANHWRAYCSALSRNANCIGILEEPQTDAHFPDKERHRRNYVINRCVLPHGLLTQTIQAPGPFGFDQEQQRNEFRILDRLSTAELEHLLAELYAQYQQRTPLGKLLFYDVPPRNLAEQISTVETIVRDRVAAESRTLRQIGVSACRQMDVLMDGVALERFAADPEANRHAGVIEEVLVNRMGNFSCPVSIGAVFVANLDIPHCGDSGPAEAVEQTANRFLELLQGSCKDFDDLDSVDDLLDAAARGKAAGVVHAGCNHAGRWVELESQPPGRPPAALRPVAVFEFWEKPDAAAFVRANRALGRSPENGKWAGEELRSGSDGFPLEGPAPWPRQEVRASVTGRPHSEEAPDLLQQEPTERAARLRDEFHKWWELLEWAQAPQEPRMIGAYEDNFVHIPNPTAATLNVNRLEFKLKQKRAGNCLVVKLIGQENLMDQWMDAHDEPNIDATFVGVKGRQLRLPPGVQLAC